MMYQGPTIDVALVVMNYMMIQILFMNKEKRERERLLLPKGTLACVVDKHGS